MIFCLLLSTEKAGGDVRSIDGVVTVPECLVFHQVSVIGRSRPAEQVQLVARDGWTLQEPDFTQTAPRIRAAKTKGFLATFLILIKTRVCPLRIGMPSRDCSLGTRQPDD